MSLKIGRPAHEQGYSGTGFWQAGNARVTGGSSSDPRLPDRKRLDGRPDRNLGGSTFWTGPRAAKAGGWLAGVSCLSRTEFACEKAS